MASGQDIVRVAERRIGDLYVLGARIALTNPDWRGPWDCAEFVSWCVYHASGIVYGWRPRTQPEIGESYTGYWAEDAQAGGTTISVSDAAAVPGAILLRAPPTGHIAISDGAGGTIEARGRNWGVCRHIVSDRVWSHGILVPGIDYSRAAGPGPSLTAPSVYRLTRPLIHGPKVKEIQRALKRAGFDPGPLDGRYGPQTYAAVSAFQQANGLVVDGEIGADTAAVLEVRL